MMIPPKLRHGDNLANLFEKFNTVIDYLREIRLVAGNGIRINRLPAGTTIESTATATGAQQFYEALKQQRCPVQFRIIPGYGHTNDILADVGVFVEDFFKEGLAIPRFYLLKK